MIKYLIILLLMVVAYVTMFIAGCQLYYAKKNSNFLFLILLVSIIIMSLCIGFFAILVVHSLLLY